MEDVLPPEVGNSVGDRSGHGVAVRIHVLESGLMPVAPRVQGTLGADGHHRVVRTLAVGHGERKGRHDRAQGDDGVFQRTDPHGVLPAELALLRWDDDVVPRDPVEDLHVVQVEVDRVRVNTVVGDLPDLGPVGRRGDRRHVEAARHPGRIEKLCRRVDVRIQDDVLQQRSCARVLRGRGWPSCGPTRRSPPSSSRRACPSAPSSSTTAYRCRVSNLNRSVGCEPSAILAYPSHFAAGWPGLVAPTAGNEGGAVGAVVGVLTDDDRV